MRLRFSVSNLRRALVPLTTSALPINRQRDLETASLDAARAELVYSAKKLQEKGIDNHTDSQLKREQLQAWMHEWLGLLTERLQKDIATTKINVEEMAEKPARLRPTSKTNLREHNLILYLTLLSPEKLALIIILECMRAVGASGLSDGFIAVKGLRGIGKAIETEYRAETIKSVAGVDSSHWLRTIDPNTSKPSRQLISTHWRKIGRNISNKPPGSPEYLDDWAAVWTPSWSNETQAELGAYLIERFLDVAKIERTGPDPRTGEMV